ncbi:hypothetical protein BO221_38295 [Archangium sp. Cb G35]|uniref:hypothetical protein n=1 Tax=Archangium sp. Cb G35 TaxID=1920190 RepID=UPI000937C633|nr:hypothetical protein [Archangium sp. Cb G35]OJT18609.1 hypothetical protein BO221_38295 [Archangium sp. Cb G35]
MPQPKKIPHDVPDEVKLVLAHLRPVPEALAQERERLLTELTTRQESSTEALQQLQHQVAAVLVSLRPGTPFQARLASELSSALDSYLKHPGAVIPPPGIIGDCMNHVRSYLEAIGMSPLLAVVDEIPDPLPAHSGEEDRQEHELQMQHKFGSIRG